MLLASTAALSSGCASGPGGNSAAEAPFGWLEGCWRAEAGTITERWVAATESDLFGTSVIVVDGEMVFFEFMQIERGGDGYVFSAFPRGIGPNPFAARSVGIHEVVFANAEHDYPQRIAYRREGDELIAVISLLDGSRSNRWNFEPCESDQT